jgi:hypothetical protein
MMKPPVESPTDFTLPTLIYVLLLDPYMFVSALSCDYLPHFPLVFRQSYSLLLFFLSLFILLSPFFIPLVLIYEVTTRGSIPSKRKKQQFYQRNLF